MHSEERKDIGRTKYPHLRPLWSAVFMDVFGMTVLMPLALFLQTEWSRNPTEILLLMSTNAVFTFIFGPILGKLSDKYGRKPLLLISQFGTFSAFLIFAFAPNIQILYLSRAIDGMFGGNFPIAKAIVVDVAKPKDRSTQMTNIGVAHNVANLLGPAAGGFLLSFFGLLGPGLLGAFLSLGTIIITFLYLEESAPSKTGKKGVMPGMEGQLSQNLGGGSPHTEVNKDDLKIWKNKIAMILLLQWGLHTMAFMTFLSGFSLFAGRSVGLTVGFYGALMSISGIFQIIIRYTIFNPMLRKIGERRTVIIGLSLFVLSFSFVGLVTEIYQLVIFLLTFSFAASCTRGVLTSFLSRSVHPKTMGKVMGYSASLDSFAQIFGPMISSVALVNWDLSYYGVVSGSLSFVALLLMIPKFEFKYDFKKGPPVTH
jgi:MFS family permease